MAQIDAELGFTLPVIRAVRDEDLRPMPGAALPAVQWLEARGCEAKEITIALIAMSGQIIKSSPR
jgi:hypothetical protein